VGQSVGGGGKQITVHVLTLGATRKDSS